MPLPTNPLKPLLIETYQLPNGLPVYLLEDHALPVVAVNINYRAGSKDEKPGKTGLAHLFEHMMFQGSAHHPAGYFRPLQDAGGTVNGGTSSDRTRYWEFLPAAWLERALWLESDRMGFLLEALDEERLRNQIEVVQNERRQSYENRPYGLVMEKVMAALYPPGHPYSWPTIGWMEDIASFTLEDLRQFFRSYYAPNNASLCLAGDFDPAAAKAMVERLFGTLPPGPPVMRPGQWQPALAGEIRLHIQDRVQLPRTYLAWPTVPIFSRDDAALDVFAMILGEGKTSRLHQQLVYEKQAAQEVMAYHHTGQVAGHFMLVLTPRPGHDAEKLEESALEIIHVMINQGISQDELQRALAGLVSSFVQNTGRLGGFSGLSDKLNEYVHYLGEPDRFCWDLDRYLALTPAQVAEAGQRYLREGRVLARVEPFPAWQPAAPAIPPDRSALPGAGSQAAFRLPARQSFFLSNGLPVTLVEQHRAPLVAAGVMIRCGSAADPENRWGLADLTADLLLEGAAGRGSRAFAEELDRLGASLTAAAGRDAVSLYLSSLQTVFPEALALLAAATWQPAFSPEEQERIRRRKLIRLAQLSDQPQYLAQLAFQRMVFDGHPYGHPGPGLAGHLRETGRNDVPDFWRTYFQPANARLVVAGDITRSELEPLLESSFGGWTPGPPPAFADAVPVTPRERTIYLVDKPGAVQSVIVAGLPGPARTTPDYPALETLNAVLGGQFVSRLNLKLREEHGFTYGASSSFSYHLLGGWFQLTAAVKTETTAAAVQVINQEMAALAGERPVTEDEVVYARNSLVNGYEKRFETAEQLLRELIPVVFYGLPPDELETLPLRLAAVTREEVQRGTVRLPAERLAVVVAGDRALIRPALLALNLGPVVDVSPEGSRLA